MLKMFIEFKIQLKWCPSPYLDYNNLQILNILDSTQLSKKSFTSINFFLQLFSLINETIIFASVMLRIQPFSQLLKWLIVRIQHFSQKISQLLKWLIVISATDTHKPIIFFIFFFSPSLWPIQQLWNLL